MELTLKDFSTADLEEAIRSMGEELRIRKNTGGKTLQDDEDFESIARKLRTDFSRHSTNIDEIFLIKVRIQGEHIDVIDMSATCDGKIEVTCNYADMDNMKVEVTALDEESRIFSEGMAAVTRERFEEILETLDILPPMEEISKKINDGMEKWGMAEKIDRLSKKYGMTPQTILRNAIKKI